VDLLRSRIALAAPAVVTALLVVGVSDAARSTPLQLKVDTLLDGADPNPGDLAKPHSPAAVAAAARCARRSRRRTQRRRASAFSFRPER